MNHPQESIRAAILEVFGPDSPHFNPVAEWLDVDRVTTRRKAQSVALVQWMARLGSLEVAKAVEAITRTGWTNADGYEPGFSSSVEEAIRLAVVEVLGTNSGLQSVVIDFLKCGLSSAYECAYHEAGDDWLAQLNSNRVARALVEVTAPNHRNADLLVIKLDHENKEAQ